MKRREFIALAAAGAAGTALPALGGERPLPPEAVLELPRLLRILPGRVVYNLGLRYREMTPAENSERALRTALRTHLDATAPLAAQVHDQVQREFAEAQTVTVNGWILSVTEARQCALHSFVAL
jgi:hypothetical protein